MYVGNAQSKHSLLLNNAELDVVVEVKDLGVTVESHLNFDVYIHQAVTRALWELILYINTLYLVIFPLVCVLLKCMLYLL